MTLGWVDELPLDDIPNAANLRDDLVNPPWDPEGRYSLPWQTGITGIAYNLERHRPRADVDQRPVRSRVQRTGSACSPRCATPSGWSCCRSASTSRRSPASSEAEEAFAKLEQAKDDGQIRAFTGNDYLADLESGNFAACIGWSGDVAQLSHRQPEHPLHHPRGGRRELGRHDADAQGRRAPRRGGAVDGLRLRPGAGGADHGVGAVRLAGQGRAGGGRQDRRRSWPRTR